jgi:hypothetical protein
MRLNGTSSGWGGARPGSGRQPTDLSEKEKRKLISAARKMVKQTGKTVWDILVYHIYNAKAQPRVSVAAIRIYQDAVIAKESYRTVDHYNHGIAEIPTMESDPADAIEPPTGVH